MAEEDVINCFACYHGVCETQGSINPHKLEYPPTKCIGCSLFPESIYEYVEMRAETLRLQRLSYDELIRKEEGTYGIKGPGTFYCTTCYVAAGMPTHYGRIRRE